MKNMLLARKYAAAVFGLAVEHGTARAVSDELQQVAEALAADEDVFQFFTDPSTPASEKDRVFEQVAPQLAMSPECAGLFRIMIANERMGIFPDVVEEVRRMADDLDGRVEAEVASARELLPEEQERIRKALSAWSKKTVTLRCTVDRSLIGGVVARVGNAVIDGSVTGRLAAFAETTE